MSRSRRGWSPNSRRARRADALKPLKPLTKSARARITCSGARIHEAGIRSEARRGRPAVRLLRHGGTVRSWSAPNCWIQPLAQEIFRRRASRDLLTGGNARPTSCCRNEARPDPRGAGHSRYGFDTFLFPGQRAGPRSPVLQICTAADSLSACSQRASRPGHVARHVAANVLKTPLLLRIQSRVRSRLTPPPACKLPATPKGGRGFCLRRLGSRQGQTSMRRVTPRITSSLNQKKELVTVTVELSVVRVLYSTGTTQPT